MDNENNSKEVMSMISPQTREIINSVIREEGWDKIYMEQAKRETALRMLNRGFQLEDIADMLDMPINWVENLTKQ